jgi:hypothetical protein
MNVRTVALFYLFAILLCFNHTSQAQTHSWENIKLQIETQKHHFIYGEPVVLRMKITNTGEEDVIFPTLDLGIAFETVTAQIFTPDQKTQTYRTWYIEEPSHSQFKIPSQNSRNFDIRLHWNAETDTYAFDATGEHRVRLTLINFSGGDNLSSESTVFITLSNVKALKTASDMLLSRETAAILQGVSEPNTVTIKQFEKLINTKSTLSPYFSEALGRVFLKPHFDRPANPERAKNYFEQTLELQDENLILKQDAKKGLINIFIMENNLDSAEKSLKEIELEQFENLNFQKLKLKINFKALRNSAQ